MHFENRVCQKLHAEHATVLDLLDRVTQAAARYRDGVPDAKDPFLAKLMSDIAADLPGEVSRHFDFEEAELFSYLREAGNAGIGNVLTHEHSIIRPIGAELCKLIAEVRANGFDSARWAEFRKLGQQLAMHLGPHAQKEDMALLPMLEQAMDADKEAELYEKYVLQHA
jgi:hemerythrin-like domain-containing protein